ncbi:nitrilase-related carbon-nitrogen hydrolase [Algoriphagus namhaensis]
MRKVIIGLLSLLLAYLIWSTLGRRKSHPEPSPEISQIQEINRVDSLDRVVIGIQPYMVPSDYLDQMVFKTKIRMYFQEALEKGLLLENSIVLLPEYLGTWLVIEGEKTAIADKASLEEALSLMVMSNLGSFGYHYLKANGEEDRAAATVFRMKAEEMADNYFVTFSELAQEYKTHIVAGSIVLPKPEVIQGEIIVDPNDDLYNSSFIFGPDGKIVGQPILKAFPIISEQAFLAKAKPEALPTFDLPFAKTSVLICADSWFPESYSKTKTSQTELILVPSYCAGENTMGQLWQGYSGFEAPSSTDLSDIGRLNEGEAWEKYALPGQIRSTQAQAGMNVFLRGELWDLGTDGQPFVISEGKLLEIQTAEKAGIWALYF